jgi:hypothetical protein
MPIVPPSDTAPEVDRILLELLRSTPAWRKLELMSQLNEMARTLILNQLRTVYPGADEAELRRRLADRLLEPTMAEKVYGPRPPDP